MMRFDPENKKNSQDNGCFDGGCSHFSPDFVEAMRGRGSQSQCRRGSFHHLPPEILKSMMEARKHYLHAHFAEHSPEFMKEIMAERKKQLQKHLGCDFVDFPSGVFDFSSPCRSVSTGSFSVQVKEDEGKYIVCAELPGVQKEELNLEYVAGKLTIQVNRKERSTENTEFEVESQGKSAGDSEANSPAEERSLFFALCSGEGIQAQLKDGVLKIVVPKAKSRKIELNETN